MKTYSILTDLELFRKISAYDSRALETLYDRYSPLLFTVIKRIVAEETLAEEVLTEVFAVIWRKIDHFDFSTGNVYAWLILLSRNKAVDFLRRRKTRNAVADEYTEEYENTFIIPHLSKGIDQLDLESALNVKSNVELALNKLTDAQKYVIYLAFYEGYSQAAIAGKLNIPLPTVKSKIQIALSNLKDNLIKG
ncbi:MAG: RNA polymerase sigma factor [Bacteroidota bacterium]|nr:sigma-70 family RNA polymerase sigma factor [Ignavibacteria bacterium]MCU7500604.1 sigma-70 family RNA polymerase sigma factor [Ignavibacteria bacterium]MCU7514009.1 sigma-70 family RNA polymerase sigma factor [Ignavibacteria bacterium]MCU7521277.1 sigma-70 family RNA polymerase sigma factor [Ignavibacteria bacterium]MCU7525943.1 sigma-70 family RNA polymerase sigma factor [Ignavibacteria bacterium]